MTARVDPSDLEVRWHLEPADVGATLVLDLEGGCAAEVVTAHVRIDRETSEHNVRRGSQRLPVDAVGAGPYDVVLSMLSRERETLHHERRAAEP